jgi:hypothetical protein
MSSIRLRWNAKHKIKVKCQAQDKDKMTSIRQKVKCQA